MVLFQSGEGRWCISLKEGSVNAVVHNNILVGGSRGAFEYSTESRQGLVMDYNILYCRDGGAVVTEFLSKTNPDRHNFVQRNRIVAGLSDAVVVVESGIKGGALITARIASSYNRDVLAFPGNPNEELSKGCNYLIKRNVAALIESIDDLEYALGWESKVKTGDEVMQRKIFTEFSSKEEKQLYSILTEEKELTSSELSLKSNLPISQVNALLLNLEFEGLVKALPGNAFRVLM